jgi:hypothetical protein
MKTKHIYKGFCIFALIWIFCAVVKTQDNQREILQSIQDSGQRTDTVRLTDTVYLDTLPEISLRDSVWEFILAVGMEHPEIVFRQCLLESARFSSPIWIENNNCVGMKVAKQRPTLAMGENRGHAVFNRWQDCILDLRIWQIKYYKDTTENYFNFLERKGYAESTEYERKLKGIKLN